jgi:hypothetical protein
MGTLSSHIDPARSGSTSLGTASGWGCWAEAYDWGEPEGDADDEGVAAVGK